MEVDLFFEPVGLKSEDLDIIFEGEPIQFFNLIFTQDLVARIEAETNLYNARQRGARNFRPVTARDRDVKTASNKRPETVFGCVLCYTHLCNELCFNQFHAQLNKNKIKR